MATGHVHRKAVWNPKEGMTLDEVAAAIDEARKQGIAGNTKVVQSSTWRSGIKVLIIEGPVNRDATDER